MGVKVFKYLGIIFFICALFFSIFILYLGHISSFTKSDIDDFFKQAQSLYNVEIRGVIHIGASTGEELNIYKNLKVQDVLWIEADPKTYAKLVDNIIINKDLPNSIAENFAASNENGEAEFYITSNKVSSSLMQLDLHKSVYPEIKFEETIMVKTKKLDTYFEESGIDVKKYNSIVIDVQGAELLALKGAKDTLKFIDLIVSEISPDSMYENSVKIYDLDQFLLENDFVRLDTKMLAPICGDALYVKKDVISRSLR